ncbi:Spo12 family-domain-containing protein [Thermoascus aurantiacus ATCC 26904]
MDAATIAQTQPLADRSPNARLQASNGHNGGDLKAAAADVNSLEYHRQVLQEKLARGENRSQGTYVSPSDDIMSPCTKKLSDLKGKRFKNAGKPQSLFAKLGKKSFEKSSSSAEESTEGSGNLA